MPETESIGTLARKHLASLGAGNTSAGLTPGGHKPQNWPAEAYSMCVHPTDLPKTHAKLAASGVKCEFTKMGVPILTSNAHRTKVARALGYCDMNAGYSGPAPTQEHEDRYKQRQADRLEGFKRMFRATSPHLFSSRG